MLEHFCVAEVKGFKLGKAELGKDIIGGISAWDYPVDIPYILFWIVFVGRFSGYEYGGIMWYGNGFILKDKRAAAFGAVEDLVIVIALGSYNVNPDSECEPIFCRYSGRDFSFPRIG